MRELNGLKNTVIGIWIVALVLFQIYTATFGIFQPYIQRGVHLLFLLPLSFLLFPATIRSPTDNFTRTDAFLAILSLIPLLYIIINSDALLLRLQFVDEVSSLEVALGTLMIGLMLEGIRRAVVPAMTYLIIVFFCLSTCCTISSWSFLFGSDPIVRIYRNAISIHRRRYLWIHHRCFGHICCHFCHFRGIYGKN